MKCEWCGKEVLEVCEVHLDGTDDFYRLEVCKKCNDIISSDYYEPEYVDKQLRRV